MRPVLEKRSESNKTAKFIPASYRRRRYNLVNLPDALCVSATDMTSNQAVKRVNSSELPHDVQALLQEEAETLESTHASLIAQLAQQGRRLNRERVRARDLTSTMIATRRDEDRVQLASDEAVSHALATQHDDAVEVLETLTDKPYFARVVLEEEESSGQTRTIEYKIGYAANPERQDYRLAQSASFEALLRISRRR